VCGTVPSFNITPQFNANARAHALNPGSSSVYGVYDNALPGDGAHYFKFTIRDDDDEGGEDVLSEVRESSVPSEISAAGYLIACGLFVQDDEVDVAVTEAKTTISADDDDDKKADAASKQKVTAVPAGTSGPASSFVHAPREVLSKYGASFDLWICIASLTAHAEYG